MCICLQWSVQRPSGGLVELRIGSAQTDAYLLGECKLTISRYTNSRAPMVLHNFIVNNKDMACFFTSCFFKVFSFVCLSFESCHFGNFALALACQKMLLFPFFWTKKMPKNCVSANCTDWKKWHNLRDNGNFLCLSIQIQWEETFQMRYDT